MEGVLTHRSSVAFTVFAPSKPCAKRTLSTPGSWQMTSISGSRQMAAASLRSNGSAGCSKTPTDPAKATSMMASNAKLNRSLPVKICKSSRIAKESRPHGSARVRRMRGRPLPCDVCPCAAKSMFSSAGGVCTPRTRDQVSHGGPAMKPTTCPSRIAASHSRRVSSLVASPQCLSMTISRDTTTRLYGASLGRSFSR